MTTYRIMYWHDIPYQIKAQDAQGVIKQPLSNRFSQAINSASIARQKYENNAYANGWKWSKKQTTEASAQEIIVTLSAELESSFDREKLRELFLTKGIYQSTVVKDKKDTGKKYEQYFDWTEPVKSAPSHRILAMRRGEKPEYISAI